MIATISIPVADLDYAEQLQVPLGIDVSLNGTETDHGTIILIPGLDLAGRDIRSYETLLQTEEGRASLDGNDHELGMVALWQNLRDEGMRNPLVVIGKQVEIGNRRLACIRALGWETVDVVCAKDSADALRIYREEYR